MGNCQRKLRQQAGGDRRGQETDGSGHYQKERKEGNAELKNQLQYLLCKHEINVAAAIGPLAAKCVSLHSPKQQHKSNRAAGAGRREGGRGQAVGTAGEGSSPAAPLL